jgi:nitrile hydratase beta subunit
MNGAHDLGGKQGLGPIDPEPEAEEPVFHAPWERRVFAMTLATGMLGRWNIDESRHARERQHPVDYLRHSYYENWLAGLETLLVEKGLLEKGLVEKGLVEKERLEKGQVEKRLLEQRELKDRDVNTAAAAKIAVAPPHTPPHAPPHAPQFHSHSLRVPDAADASKLLSSGGPSTLPSLRTPKYEIGARVLVKKIHKSGHSRSPHYAQGSVGTVVDQHGPHVYPDMNTCGDKVAEHLYAICFSFTSLWGSESDTGTDTNKDNAEVIIDLWEPYLELAP